MLEAERVRVPPDIHSVRFMQLPGCCNVLEILQTEPLITFELGTTEMSWNEEPGWSCLRCGTHAIPIDLSQFGPRPFCVACGRGRCLHHSIRLLDGILDPTWICVVDDGEGDVQIASTCAWTPAAAFVEDPPSDVISVGEDDDCFHPFFNADDPHDADADVPQGADGPHDADADDPQGGWWLVIDDGLEDEVATVPEVEVVADTAGTESDRSESLDAANLETRQSEGPIAHVDSDDDNEPLVNLLFPPFASLQREAPLPRHQPASPVAPLPGDQPERPVAPLPGDQRPSLRRSRRLADNNAGADRPHTRRRLVATRSDTSSIECELAELRSIANRDAEEAVAEKPMQDQPSSNANSISFLLQNLRFIAARD